MRPLPDLPRRRIAMLVDGENCPATLLATMFAEASRHGQVTIRRVYGDWTKSNMANWKQPLQKLAFQPIQQFHHTAGKNATDCAMIVDAMDILHAGVVQGFCLGSSDSDFTRLAVRLREQGCFVMGIGTHQTLEVLVAACDEFVFLPAEDRPNGRKPAAQTAERFVAGSEGKPDPLPLLEAVFSELQIDYQWVDLSVLGGVLRELDSDFRPQVYGYRQLHLLCRDYPELLEVKQHRQTYHVRLRPGASFHSTQQSATAAKAWNGEQSSLFHEGDEEALSDTESTRGRNARSGKARRGNARRGNEEEDPEIPF